jgi:hypothetical protein
MGENSKKGLETDTKKVRHCHCQTRQRIISPSLEEFKRLCPICILNDCSKRPLAVYMHTFDELCNHVLLVFEYRVQMQST